MLSISEALACVRREAGRSEVLRVPLPLAAGRVLAEGACADRDFPPFDRSMVDGYAVRSADVTQDKIPAELNVSEYLPAGVFSKNELQPGKAARIMTGAPVPAGADGVIMIEQTENAGAFVKDLNGPVRVKILKGVKPEANIARRASDARTGAALLTAGTTLGPAQIGILAAIGCAEVPIYRAPRLAILGTGDELVEPASVPGPAQIRNSNSYQLLAQARLHGLDAEYLGIAPDEPVRTRRMIEQGLQADALIVTGGVSVGDRDFAGAAFRELGVQIFFDKVAVKPGKPTTFGRHGKTLVFGLPGNPVAALVCFHVFVMTALRERQGMLDPLPRSLRLPLKSGLKPGGERPVFRPARLEQNSQGMSIVAALEWHGSGDLTACAQADGFIFQEANQTPEAGQPVDFYPLHA